MVSLLLVIGASVALGYALKSLPPQSGSGNGPAGAPSFPKDIYPQRATGFRQ